MQSLLLKLEADVAARKRPQTEIWPTFRNISLALVLLYTAFHLGAKSADAPSGWIGSESQSPRSATARLDALEGQVALQRAYIDRLERIQENSSRYGISADLAAQIEDIALSENIDPRLAFGLVRVESNFVQRAVSPVGAIGYAQVMPATARFFAPGIHRQQLFDAETNLRIGFRFLYGLIHRYDGDVHLALTAYNRGPTVVDRLRAQGVDPGNGYAEMVLKK